MRAVSTILAFSVLAMAAACGESEPTPPPTPDPGSLRALAQGAVVGFEGHFGAHNWKGVPFAQAPEGDLRWRAPRPAEPWQGTREALAGGAPCPQFASPGGGPEGEKSGEPMGHEDCLFANVFAPQFAPGEVPTGDARLPVMVWIHGGGNTIGDIRPYDGGQLATRHDLVVVTVQYRLGVFGWFSHPALWSEHDNAFDQSGNWGTLDLIQALAWVRENAEAFGGDPDNITIFGESAGATNVLSLLASPAARGSFHRAISQSGGFRTTTRAEAENLPDASEPGEEGSSGEVLLRLLIADGDVDRSAAKVKVASMTEAEIDAYLRGKDTGEILGVFDGAGLGGMYSVARLIRDGAVLPVAEPEAVFADPEGTAAVPAMLGTNRDENKLFLLFGSDYVRRAFGIPMWIKDERGYDLQAEYQSKFWKASGVDRPAAAMRDAREAPVFAYRFDWDEEPKLLWADFSKMLGAAHALEIPFVFGTFDLGPGNRFLWDDERIPARDELSDAMMSYWAQFAYTGDPGRGRSGTLAPWRQWDTSNAQAPKFLVLDTPEGGGIRMSPDEVDPEQLLAAIATDDRFESQQERCTLYYQLATRGRAIDPSDYATVGDGACRDFPFESYPWTD